MEKVFQKFGFTKNFLLWGAFLVAFFFVVFFLNVVMFPEIVLNGGNYIEVEYQEEYQEIGYRATQYGEDITKDVVVDGNVDSGKLGEYRITYRVGSGIFSRKVVRVVEVKDNTLPVLDISSEDAYVCPGEKYVVEKVPATDNYDGDLTSKVKSVVKKDMVIYSVRDSSGNKRSVQKKIIYQDIENPVITLKGDNIIDICANEVYRDPGYQAIDNCDKDISNLVEVIGVVDNSLIGEYDLLYKVRDAAGNEGSANRKVRVSNSDFNGVVYLTFDDGPNEGTTDVILDILKEEGVEATFFVTSKGPDDLIVREYQEGHTVALHTSSHNYASVYSSEDAFFQDLQIVSDRVERLTGEKSKYIRFPGGSSNTISRRYSQGIMSRLTQDVLSRGYKYYDWNISSGDAGETTDPKEVYKNVTENLRRDRVNMVLMHDVKPHTRDALRDIIHYCRENGYQMKKITGCSTMIKQKVNN